MSRHPREVHFFGRTHAGMLHHHFLSNKQNENSFSQKADRFQLTHTKERVCTGSSNDRLSPDRTCECTPSGGLLETVLDDVTKGIVRKQAVWLSSMQWKLVQIQTIPSSDRLHFFTGPHLSVVFPFLGLKGF